MGASLRDLVGKIWTSIGTRNSPGLLGLGFFEVWLGYKIALTNVDALMGYGAVLAAVNGAAFLSGAWKNHSDKKFASSSSAPAQNS